MTLYSRVVQPKVHPHFLIPKRFYLFSPHFSNASNLKGGQPEGVRAVLDAEAAHEEAVHAKENTSPQEDGKRLGARILDPGDLDSQGDGCKGKDTIYSCDNLRLKTILVAESTSKVRDATLLVSNNVGRLPDVVEHVAASEQQHGNETDGSPEVAVLNERNHVWPSNEDSCDATQNSSSHRDDLDPVDGAGHGGLGHAIGDVARDPGVDLLGSLRATGEVEADGLCVGLCVGTSGGVEVEQHGSSLKHHLYTALVSVSRIVAFTVAYRLENISAIDKVQCTEYQPRLAVLVTLHPAVAQQVPFWLEFPAEHTSKSGLQRSEQNGNSVIAGRLCELGVAGVVELERAAGGEGFGASVIEAVARGFLSS